MNDRIERKPQCLGQPCSRLPEPRETHPDLSPLVRQHQLKIGVSRKCSPSRRKRLLILDLKADHDAVPGICLLHTHIGFCWLPFLALRSEPLDVRLPKILLRPIRLGRQITRDKALVILLRKCLVSEQPDWVLTARPLASRRLVAESCNRAGLRI